MDGGVRDGCGWGGGGECVNCIKCCWKTQENDVDGGFLDWSLAGLRGHPWRAEFQSSVSAGLKVMRRVESSHWRGIFDLSL